MAMPAITPAMPSKRPPEGTESLCDPTTIAGHAACLPSRRPMRLPPASTRVRRPASRMRSVSQARPWSNSGENERRV